MAQYVLCIIVWVGWTLDVSLNIAQNLGTIVYDQLTILTCNDIGYVL